MSRCLSINVIVTGIIVIISSPLTDLPNDTKNLILTCYPKGRSRLMTRLTAEGFSHLPQVTHIQLRGCPIASIDQDAFRDLQHLESLTIGRVYA